MPDPVRFPRMTTDEIRESFLITNLFTQNEISLRYFNLDRTVVGSAVPFEKPLTLEGSKALGSEFFGERREIGILNIGSKGVVHVDGTDFAVEHKDCLYIGRGAKEIHFKSETGSNPARFYLLSYPAHQEYPIKLARKTDANKMELGSMEASNKRTIYQMIHPGNIPTCQLVMGFTELESGCVWNTMPPHTHERRMEVYLYFGMNPDTRVFHLMGPPRETRHVVVAEGEAVASPSWSIHSGVGTGSYTFCWGMGGENQVFDDMDGIDIGDLR